MSDRIYYIEEDFMITHSNNYYLDKMSLDTKKVVLSILSKKSNYNQLKEDVERYYKLRALTDEVVTKR